MKRLHNAIYRALGWAACLAAIVILNLGTAENAGAWGLLPALVSGGGGATNTNFLTWDELETGWGDLLNTNICNAENGVSGGDEGSLGVVSGADLVHIESGNIPGASGSPLTRALDGTDDYWVVTTTFIDTFLAFDNPVFSIIIKVDTWEQYEADQAIIRYMADAGGNNGIYCVANSGGQIRVDFADGGTDTYTDYTTDPMPKTGAVYIYVESDGANIKCGWDTVRRGSWDEISANQKSIKAKAITWAGVSFSEQRFILGCPVSTNYPKCNWHYTIHSKKTLEQISQ